MNGDLHTIIIGGGLAGLTAAIDLAQSNIPVTLIEKDTYPRHKVCGEYISNEVLPYFKSLQIDIERLKPSRITRFQISTQSGKIINSALPLGGFGVSRYVLDHYLWEKAISSNYKFCCKFFLTRSFDFKYIIVKLNIYNLILNQCYPKASGFFP